MQNPRFTAALISMGFIAFSAGTACGQAYPNKPIRIVTAAAGGNNDGTARIIAQGISGPLGQPMIVDNRPNGVIPGEIVSRAAPDGYTLLVYNNGFWLGPLLLKSPYDPVRDFLPVSLTDSTPSIIVVHPALAANSVKDLIALARSKPGELNYATTGGGSSSYLAGELFKALSGVNIVNIAYKGVGLALIDLIAGRVQLMIPPSTATAPHVKSGRLRALAVTSAEPSPLYPGLPTAAASGLPGYELVSRTGVFVPAKTPAAIIRRLNQELVQYLHGSEAKQKFLSVGVETVGSSPEQFAAVIKSEISLFAKVIKEAGIKPE
jgi:tripartite-type tricarboxylate transporter receptor subunit TctC